MTTPTTILEQLVRVRTDQQGGDEPRLAKLLAEALRARGADDVQLLVTPRPGLCDAASVYARFGQPTTLVNAHLDTVPPNAGWSADPFSPRTGNGRLTALGAADTKGAIAAILAALGDVRPRGVGILFSGDEECGGACMRDFLAGPFAQGLLRAIVCEPTGLRAGIRHRGIVVVEVVVTGPGGHSSLADHLPRPLAVLARVAAAIDDWGVAHREKGPPGFHGMCVNIARLDGGVAFNVIPASATLQVSVRPWPGAELQAIGAELQAIALKIAPDATVRFVLENQPFATRALEAFRPSLGEVIDRPIDLGFWTEAAMLSAAGIDAVVYGPGAIEQAHAPDEWVSIDELERARAQFASFFRSTVGGLDGTR